MHIVCLWTEYRQSRLQRAEHVSGAGQKSSERAWQNAVERKVAERSGERAKLATHNPRKALN